MRDRQKHYTRKHPINGRKTLYYEGLPIRAAGLILYIVDPNTKDTILLLQRRPGSNQWEDLGGKVEHQDKTIHHTMAREAMEETHGRLDMRDLLRRLQSQPLVYFVGENKYVFTMLPATLEDIQKPIPGMEWIAVSSLRPERLFPRLRHPHFLRVLNELKEIQKQI